MIALLWNLITNTLPYLSVLMIVLKATLKQLTILAHHELSVTLHVILVVRLMIPQNVLLVLLIHHH